jgi:hypothetical protein
MAIACPYPDPDHYDHDRYNASSGIQQKTNERNWLYAQENEKSEQAIS